MLLAHAVRWKVHGRDFNGMDCMGVLIYLYREAGVTLPDPMSRHPAEVLRSAIYKHFEKLPTLHPEYGCVASYYDGQKVNQPHLGVVFGDQVVHAVESRGVVATRWRLLKPAAFYRLKSGGA